MNRKEWRKKRVEHRRWAKMQPDYCWRYDSGYSVDVAFSRSGCRAVRFEWLRRANIERRFKKNKRAAWKILRMVRRQRLGFHGVDLIEMPRIFGGLGNADRMEPSGD